MLSKNSNRSSLNWFLHERARYCPSSRHRTQRARFDEIVEISEEEVLETFEIARKTAKEEGLLVGMSSGAVLYVALGKAKELGKDETIVAVLPDSVEKYLSTTLFQS